METTKKAFKSQLENRNPLKGSGFRLTINTLPRVAFYGQECNIPSLEGLVAIQSALPNPIPWPGDNLIFGDFIIDFMVDEDMKNYLELLYWMYGIYYPESLKQTYDFQCNRENFEQPDNSTLNLFADGSLLITTSNYNLNYTVKFKEMFPYKLSDLNFNSKTESEEYVTCTAYFKYMNFEILRGTKEEILDKPID